ncbi:leucine-rich repeat neuronal protein 1-like [Liolophura sinensis]|uniref:leucine-rich repeat neuronal protein 1-like n=1 Tax=Liolophura sinensis TaxID=3198878 RepID=UPI003158CCF8
MVPQGVKEAFWQLRQSCVLLLLLHLLAGNSATTSAICPDVCVCSGDGQDAVCQDARLDSLPPGLSTDLRTLSLHNNRFTTQRLSGQLEKFPELYKLDLAYNSIREIPSHMLTALPKLHTLSLTSNQITTIHTGAFTNLTYLEQLDLSSNLLQQVDHTIGIDLLHVKLLNLSHNNLNHLGNLTFQNFQKLRVLDLSFNHLAFLDPDAFSGLLMLEELYLQWNKVANSFDIMSDWSQSLPSILQIDISHNMIVTLDNHTVQSNFEMLQYLDISYNDLAALPANMFSNYSQLKVLNLGKNPLQNLTDDVFEDISQLEKLYLDNCTSLRYIPNKLFEPLTSLQYLNLSNNPQLGYLATSTFDALASLRVLDLSRNNLSSLPEVIFQHTSSLQQLYLSHNPLTCDCNLAWLLQLMESSNTVLSDQAAVRCTYTNNSSQARLQDLSKESLACEPPILLSNDTDVYWPIGSSAFLSCDVYSIPAPVITWITPRHQRLVYHDHHPLATGHLPSREDVEPGSWFHKNHPWHFSSSYYSQLPESERIILLGDGTLFIDYVQRHDGGPYQCIVDHPQGNLSRVITLHLDHNVIQSVKLMSIIVGLSLAVSFFTIATAIWVIKVAANRCINQRKREAIKNIIDNLDAYKTHQIGRIKEISANQMGKFRDQYHFQLERLRDNYNQQMYRIRENCAQQMDKIRDNYATHVGRIKDYSSNRLERLRDNYNAQIIRIREYGSLQLERLRENYKLQQQHLIKLLETMNFDTCKTVIETDCVRADSMLFDSEVFVEPMVDLPYLLETDPPSCTGSELDYVTASSNSDSLSNTMDTCSSLHDVEDNAFKPSAMQLLPGLVIQMPHELCPDNPVELSPDLILPPPPILELPLPSSLPSGGAAESDTQSETESCHREHHRKPHHRRRKVKHRPKGVETTVVVEAAALLQTAQNKDQSEDQGGQHGSDKGPGQSTDPLLTSVPINTGDSAVLVVDSSQSSDKLHPLSQSFGPERESIV